MTDLVEDSVEDNQATTNEQTEGHNLISFTKLIQVTGEGPRGCIGVVRLHRSAAPGRVAIAITEELSVTANDADHDGIVDEASQDGSPDLSEEHDARWDLDLVGMLVHGSSFCNRHLRYSPILRSPDRLTALEITL